MKRKRRFGAEEINLTPLLDVLFVVLFTILLSGYSQQSKSSEKIQEMESQIETLQEQVSQYKNQNEAYDMYAKQAVILSVDNITRDDKHILRIFRGNDKTEFVLGNDNTETFKNQINGYVKDLIKGSDEQPIYIVFSCDENNIYKDEYEAIKEEMQMLENNKEVFFKINDNE